MSTEEKEKRFCVKCRWLMPAYRDALGDGATWECTPPDGGINFITGRPNRYDCFHLNLSGNCQHFEKKAGLT